MSMVFPRRPRQSERGMTTAEYAAGVVATALIGSCLGSLTHAGWFGRMFERVFDAALTRTLPDLIGWLQ
jgi:Protein of unknown function (DUF4244)